MSLNRCAVCGSPNIQRTDRNDGFSYKKALVGTAVFGTVGAVAGINGKTTVQYHCPDCGYVGATAMNDMEKTMVDMAVSSSDELFQKMPSFQAYFQKYSYLTKERLARTQQVDTSASTTSNSVSGTIQSEYSIQEVRQAAEDYYNVFHDNPRLCNFDPPYWDETPIQDIEVYKNAFQALRIIAYGLYAYPMLIVDDYEGEAFSRYNLKRAFVAFILVTYGSMSVNEIYKFAKQDPYLVRTMDVLINKENYQKAIQPYRNTIDPRHQLIYPDKEKEYKKEFFGDNTIGIRSDATGTNYVSKEKIFISATGSQNLRSSFQCDDKRIHAWEVYDRGDEDTPIEFGYKIINDTLYAALVDALKIAETENPEPTQEIVRLLKLKADEKQKDGNVFSEHLKVNKQITDENKRIESKIKLLQSEASALRSKFFGKKKNEILATEKDEEVKKLRDTIKQNEAKRTESENNWKAEAEKIAQRCNDIDRQISEQKALRAENVSKIEKWVCITGKDCPVQPQEDPAVIQARERAEMVFKKFEGRTEMETNENIKGHVYHVLQKAGTKMTVQDMMQADEDLSAFSAMRIAARVNDLVDEGFVIKTVERRKAYFQAK